MTSPRAVARRLFAPLPADYERWAALLSLGQDRRWRERMVAAVDAGPGDLVLDVAAGTGSITRLLEGRGASVVALDQSAEMLRRAHERGATAVVATAESLPFADGSFDAVTFGYLLRYVDDVPGAMGEIVRVVRPGGRVGMVEFGRPDSVWRWAWWLYTRAALPLAGIVSRPWRTVGSFLGPSIDAFADEWPPERLAAAWRDAGLAEVSAVRMSLGGGLVMTASRR